MQRKIVGALFVGTLVALLIYSVRDAIIKRSPQYVLEQESIPYQEEAIEFFNENKDRLLLLSDSRSTFTDLASGFNHYSFQYTDLDKLEISDDLKVALSEMEHSTSKQYDVGLLPDRVDVRIYSGTRLYVVLTDRYDMCYGMEEDWDIVTDLGDGWSLHVAYVVRG